MSVFESADPKKGRWGEGISKEDMDLCVWVEPRLKAIIEFAELTSAKRLRHAKFIKMV